MEFVGTMSGNEHTIFVENGRIEKIIVKFGPYEQDCYQRPPVKVGYTITDYALERAVLAVCGKSLKKWSELHQALSQDELYQEKVSDIHERRICIF